MNHISWSFKIKVKIFLKVLAKNEMVKFLFEKDHFIQ